MSSDFTRGGPVEAWGSRPRSEPGFLVRSPDKARLLCRCELAYITCQLRTFIYNQIVRGV